MMGGNTKREKKTRCRNAIKIEKAIYNAVYFKKSHFQFLQLILSIVFSSIIRLGVWITNIFMFQLVLSARSAFANQGKSYKLTLIHAFSFVIHTLML